MTRVDFYLSFIVIHLKLPFAIRSFLWWEQRWFQYFPLSGCSLKKRHLNVPLQLDSDEFVSRANPIENLGHFSKEQNQTEIVSNVCQYSKRKTKWNKFAEMAEWWKYGINLPFYLSYVAATVSLCTTEKEMIRWEWKTKRCKRNWDLYNLQRRHRNEQQKSRAGRRLHL